MCIAQEACTPTVRRGREVVQQVQVRADRELAAHVWLIPVADVAVEPRAYRGALVLLVPRGAQLQVRAYREPGPADVQLVAVGREAPRANREVLPGALHLQARAYREPAPTAVQLEIVVGQEAPRANREALPHVQPVVAHGSS